MQYAVHNRKRSVSAPAAAGFTLIELMVVMLVIGVIATFAMLSIGNRALEDRMQGEADRLLQLMKLAADEAQIHGYEVGFRTTTAGFEFLTLGPGGTWQPFDSGPLRSRSVQRPFYLELRVEGRLIKPAAPFMPTHEDDAKPGDKSGKPAFDNAAKGSADKDKKSALEPQVYLLSSGEATAFTLDFKLEKQASYYRVEADPLARFTLQHLQERK